MKLSTQDQVANFVNACRQHGFRWEVASPSVIRIHKTFTPNDGEAFTACDMFAFDILSHAPLRGGSVWGTDGGSVGGYVGLKGGYYTLNKSGQGARFMKALSKLGA